MATAPGLTQAIGATPDATERVVVDLSEVSFLDSSGLNALVRGQRGLAKREVGFRIVSPADQVVRRVFEITQLEAQLGVVETLADALA